MLRFVLIFASPRNQLSGLRQGACSRMETLSGWGKHRIQVLTDHKNLIYFTITRTLNRRQARGSSFLADYDFEILFRPRVQQGKANALSWQCDFALRPSDDAYSQQSHCLLRLDQLHMFAT